MTSKGKVIRSLATCTACVMLGTVGGYPLTALGIFAVLLWAPL